MPGEFKSQSGTPSAWPEEGSRAQGVHHVGLLCSSLTASLDFYCNLLGLKLNPDRPHSKLPYAGAWIWIGPKMIHLMELPNPNATAAGPSQLGRDAHASVGLENIAALEERLKAHGIPYVRSETGRSSIFFRDPDQNCLECVETKP